MSGPDPPLASKISSSQDHTIPPRNNTVDEVIELLMDGTYTDLYLSDLNRDLTVNEVTAFTIFIRAARGAIEENRNRNWDENNNLAENHNGNLQ